MVQVAPTFSCDFLYLTQNLKSIFVVSILYIFFKTQNYLEYSDWPIGGLYILVPYTSNSFIHESGFSSTSHQQTSILLLASVRNQLASNF